MKLDKFIKEFESEWGKLTEQELVLVEHFWKHSHNETLQEIIDMADKLQEEQTRNSAFSLGWRCGLEQLIIKLLEKIVK